ncbi:uncharacterized protein LOC141899053 [Tubulanus polymorphus]|uniref:uncharacterized protein LOC141899053 n=1 Tax=Tubulanus polymorphus TaxID=672921 RepID=UPI003DA3C76E
MAASMSSRFSTNIFMKYHLLRVSQLMTGCNSGWTEWKNTGIDSIRNFFSSGSIHDQANEGKDNFFDEQYFENASEMTAHPNQLESNKSLEPSKRSRIKSTSEKTDNYFDEEYFLSQSDAAAYSNNIIERSNDIIPSKEETENVVAGNSCVSDSNLHFIDSQYFATPPLHHEKNCDSDFIGLQSFVETSQRGKKQHIPNDKKTPTPQSEMKTVDNINATLPSDDEGTIFVNKESALAKRINERIVPNIENPKTAFDHAMKIRRELKSGRKSKGPDVDSKGFRILKYQTPDFSTVMSQTMVRMIKDAVVYNDGDIVIIDKPYGIASHGGPGVQHSIGKMLGDLTKLLFPMSSDKLQLLHRLDKECTGILVLARTPQTVSRIKKMFKDREVIKKYWFITKGIPSPEEGVIDIPMKEVKVGNHFRMGLIPEKVMTRKQIEDASQAITQYRILDKNGSAAIVECQPVTGVKHQIRTHMAFGLNCPILGDHKYSHLTKLAPQRLHADILLRLGIRQAKARHVPMHLHAKSIVLPHILDGRNLFVRTNLPSHFSKNMKRLKLKPGIW